MSGCAEHSNKNVFCGHDALHAAYEGSDPPGFDNTAFGHEALKHLHPLYNESTAIGSGALKSATGGENTAVGAHAAENNGRANANTAIGNWALRWTSGEENTAVGFRAMASDKFMGHELSLKNTNGNRNVSVGAYSMQFEPHGDDDVAVGFSSMMNIHDGSNNTGVGSGSLLSLTHGDDNTGIGFNSLVAATEGNDNTAVGSGSLPNVQTGVGNSAVGTSTGSQIILGSNNTFLGSGADSSSDGNYRTAIGSGTTVSQDNSIILGRVDDKIGIGTSSPDSSLHVAGSGDVDSVHIFHSNVITGSGVALHVDGGIRNKVVVTNVGVYVANVNDYIIVASKGNDDNLGTTMVVLPNPSIIPQGQTYIVRSATADDLKVDSCGSNVDFMPFGSGTPTDYDTITAGEAAMYVSALDPSDSVVRYFKIA